MLTLLTMGPLLAVSAPIIPLPQDGLSVIESVSESISYSYFGVMVESSFRDNETIFVPASEDRSVTRFGIGLTDLVDSRAASSDCTRRRRARSASTGSS